MNTVVPAHALSRGGAETGSEATSGFYYLRLRDDGAVLCRTSVKRRQRRGDDDGTGSDEPAQVAARNLILLLEQRDITCGSVTGNYVTPARPTRGRPHLLHDQRVHHVEHIPGHPHGPVLSEERSALEAEREGSSAVGQEIEPAANTEVDTDLL